MKRKSPSVSIVRRSVALPQELVDAVQVVAPEELRHNLNRVVIVALQEFVARQQARAFAEAMAAMAGDPEIDRLNTALAAEFRETEADGLPHD